MFPPDMNIKIDLHSLCDTARTILEDQVRAGLIEPLSFVEHVTACGVCSAQWDAWMEEIQGKLPSLLMQLMRTT